MAAEWFSDEFFHGLDGKSRVLLHAAAVVFGFLTLALAWRRPGDWLPRFRTLYRRSGKACAIACGFGALGISIILGGVYDQLALLTRYLALGLALVAPGLWAVRREGGVFTGLGVCASGLIIMMAYFFMSAQASLWLFLAMAVMVAGWVRFFEWQSKSSATEQINDFKFGVALDLVWISAAAVAFVLLIANTALWDRVIYPLMHHWSVYIVAGSNLLKGVVPYYEFPLQYGFGPAVAVAAGCAVAGCWDGMYGLVMLVTFIYFLALFFALRLSWLNKPRWLGGLDVLVAFAAALVWVGGPGTFSGLIPHVFPSTGGFRFLPLILLMLALYGERYRWAYAIGMVCAWWSPEMLIMSGMVLGLHEMRRLGMKPAIYRAVTLYGWALILFVAFFRVYWGVWPDAAAYAEYLVHIPTPLAPSVAGSMWAIYGTFILGGYCLFKQKDERAYRGDLVAVSAFLATTLYCMGRAHNQNIITLMPFMAMVAYRFIAIESDHSADIALKAQLMAGVLGVFLLMGMERPEIFPARFDLNEYTDEQLQREDRVLSRLARDDVGRTVFMRGTFAQPMGKMDQWLPIDSRAAYSFVPSGRRVIYMKRWFERHPELPHDGCLMVGLDIYQYPLEGSAAVTDGFTKLFGVVSVKNVGGYKYIGLSRLPNTSTTQDDPCRLRDQG